MWKTLFIALGFVCVLEGILPFVMPERYKHFLENLLKKSDKELRTIGLIMLLIGMGIVVVVHQFF